MGRPFLFWWLVAIMAVVWRQSSAVVVGSGSGTMDIMCADFTSFPESMAVSTGSNVCFICDYPDTEGETWSNSCSGDQDITCTCNFNDLMTGTQLCFTSFSQACSGTYQCNVILGGTLVNCGATAQIVATDERFTVQPERVTAVNGNRVSFECELLSGKNVTWQRKNSTDLSFLTSTTPPGNYIFQMGTKLTIDSVQPGHAGEYRCVLEVQDGIYLYSDFAELNYLGEGVTLSFEGTSYSLEEGESVMVCVTASGTIPDGYNIDFSVISSDGTAQSGSDYEMVNFTRTLVGILNPMCVEGFFISNLEDSLVEAYEQFTIQLTSSSFIVSTADDTIQITIENDDVLSVSLPLVAYTVAEDSGPVSVCVSSQGQLSGVAASLSLYTSDGTATDSGGDYDPVILEYSISPNASDECVVEVKIMINDDSRPEPEQCFSLHLISSDFRVNVETNTTVICIIDNDNVTIQFSQASYVFFENSIVTVNIVYDVIPENLTIRYNVTQSGQTAIVDQDYLAQNKTVAVMENSNFTYQFPIELLADDVVEGNETLSLHLSSSESKVTLNTPTTTITIVDDDKKGVLCGDLVCSNGGECLDDFVCICPSDYTGSQCETRITQDPALALFSTTPVLGGDYAATCTLTVDSEISLEEISLTVTIRWLGEFDEPLNSTEDLTIGEVVISSNMATLSLNITGLTTSHAGPYTCRASLIDGGIPITLEQGTDITFTLPAPPLVFILQVPATVPAGDAVDLRCTSILPSSITTPVVPIFEWTVGDGSPLPESSRITISPPLGLTSVLTISPALMTDTGSYTCSIYFEPTGGYLIGSPSNSSSSSHDVTVNVMELLVSLTAESDRVPNVSPYNTFELTCRAEEEDYLSLLSFQIRWVRETGAEEEETVNPDSQTTIETSDTEPVSVLRATRSQPGQYVFYCEVIYQYEEEEVALGVSNYQDVTVSGPSNPATPVLPTVYGTGVDFAIVQWIVSRVEFTPDTYYVEYGDFTDDDSDPDLIRKQYPIINANFTATDTVFMFVVDGLGPSRLYGFKIVAENSNGETSTEEFTYSSTRNQEPFIIILQEDETTSFSYPIGAAIDLQYFQTNIIQDGSGDEVTTSYVFVPELHKPLQQPTFVNNVLTVSVQYSWASPSLNGGYVLCSKSDTPLLCGGRITISVTIPSLTISTELLVSQYVDGNEVNEESPEIVCLPSDPRVPVAWSTLPVFIDLEQSYNAVFDPPGLNHTLQFPSYYRQLPMGTLRVMCDLINVDEPGVQIDPMVTTVVFVQNPVSLLNNDRVMEPNAVINSFSVYEGVDYLSLVCVGTAGNGQLQWERLSGETEGGVLGNSDDVTIDYYSDDKRDTSLTLKPVSSALAGYYSCRSTQTDQGASVLVTFQDPYFAITSFGYYDIPLGVRVDISARYAYSSNGVNNSGTGFTYGLTFIPLTSTGSTLSEGELIESGSTDPLSNNYVYSVYGSRTNGGLYNLTFTYSETQEVYVLSTEIVVTVPYIAMYEEEVVATRNQIVTLICTPSDVRAPVLWNLEQLLRRRQIEGNPFLHNYPEFFFLDPQSLRHMVTFNVSTVTRSFSVGYFELGFNCGLMDGDDDSFIVNSTDVTVILQDDKLQLEHSFYGLRIFNNTVINQLREGEGTSTTLPPPQSKRGSPVQDSLYVDCSASQGDHEPVWTTTNPEVGGDTGVIPTDAEGYGAQRLSAYMARLYFDYFDPGYEGVYTCYSELSSEFVEIIVTSRNPYVAAVTADPITVIEDNPITLVFRVAVDSNGNSWDTEEIYFMFQDETPLRFTVCDNNFPQNYCYTIASVSRFDEGTYTATASSQRDELQSAASDSIFLDVTRRCPVEVSSGIQWPWTLEDTTVSRPCSEAGSMFRTGPKASRRCNNQGEWEEADLTSCTIAEIEDPFLLVWFVIDADQYTDDQEQDFVDSMKGILDANGVVYSRVILRSVYIASVAVTFQVDLVEEDQRSNISQLSSYVSSSESFSTFSNYSVMEDGRGSVDVTVAETCVCSSATVGTSLQLCSGAALSPCDCAGDTCSCQAPFVGDGNSCTLDSDFDGYPDEPLDSPLCEEDPSIVYCIADVCPGITNPDQDPIACQPEVPPEAVFSGCPYGPDEVWGIIWPNTAAGTVNTQPCPGGVDALGNATRVCYENGTWGDVNVLSCQSLAIVRVVEEARDRLPGANEVIEEVTPELLESVAVVSEQLVMATDSPQDTGLLPLDLEATNNVVAQVLNVLESSVGEDNNNMIPSEELVDVFNNILNESNQEGWTQLQTVGSGSQTLLQNAERYGTYLATTVNSPNEPLVLVRENIVLAAEMVETSNDSDVVFPARPDQLGNFSSSEVAQITIPGTSLTRLSAQNNETGISLVYVIFRNIEEFLPTNTSVLNNSRAESLVLSSQLVGLSEDKIPDDLFRDNPITLNFSFTASSAVIERYVGVFWNFSNPVGTGGWSSDGIQVISNVTRGDVITVLCNSTHLTSFAVLVDVAGGLEDVPEEERLALQIVSYIGCIISIICLSITVVFYLTMGKKLFSAVHYFVHLNLAISLLLGYLVFVLGIELGNSNKVACGFVAALLQYLFLSAFCWMMCEGIMLYLMLIVVFSRLSKKWWFFMIIGYCTPLLFVASGLAARVEHYGVYGDDGELAFCWLSTKQGTIFAFVAPMILIIIVNTVFLVLSVMALLHSNQKAGVLGKRKSLHKAKTILKATVILLPLLGVTWLFGILTLNSSTTVFAWLFTIFNSLQGGAIFFFHVVRSKLVWNKIMYVFKKTVPVSSTNNTFSNTSESQSSAEILKSVLHKKPLDLRENGEAEPYASYSAMSVSGPPSDAELENDSLKGDNNEADITQDLAECNGTAGQ